MLNTNPRPTGSYLKLARRGDSGYPQEIEESVYLPNHSSLIVDGLGRIRAVPFWTCRTEFNLLPNTSAAAGKDPYLLEVGTSTEVVARAATGGVTITTDSGHADNDNAVLYPVAASSMIVPITAVSQPRFSCRVSLSSIVDCVFSAAMDETCTSSSTPFQADAAGDGAGFVFDPNNEGTMGLESVSGVAASTLTASGLIATFTTATAHGLDTDDPVVISGATQTAFNGTFRIIVTSTTTFTYVMGANPGVATATGSPVVTYGAANNWVLTQKVAGADVWQDSEVPVIAAKDYELEVVWGSDLIPKYYINGVHVGTGTAANTASASVGPVLAVQLNGSHAATKAFTTRYVQVERFIG